MQGMQERLPPKLSQQSRTILYNFKGRLTHSQLPLDLYIATVLGQFYGKLNKPTFQHLMTKALNYLRT